MTCTKFTAQPHTMGREANIATDTVTLAAKPETAATGVSPADHFAQNDADLQNNEDEPLVGVVTAGLGDAALAAVPVAPLTLRASLTPVDPASSPAPLPYIPSDIQKTVSLLGIDDAIDLFRLYLHLSPSEREELGYLADEAKRRMIAGIPPPEVAAPDLSFREATRQMLAEAGIAATDETGSERYGLLSEAKQHGVSGSAYEEFLEDLFRVRPLTLVHDDPEYITDSLRNGVTVQELREERTRQLAKRRLLYQNAFDLVTNPATWKRSMRRNPIMRPSTRRTLPRSSPKEANRQSRQHNARLRSRQKTCYSA